MNIEKLTDALGQEHAMAALETTSEPKTVPEITAATDIPEATCYRRVTDLSDLGLLKEIDTIRARNGKITPSIPLIY